MMKTMIFVVAAYFIPVVHSTQNETSTNQSANMATHQFNAWLEEVNEEVILSDSNDSVIQHSQIPNENALYGRLNFYDDILVMTVNEFKTYRVYPLKFNEDELNMLRMPYNYDNKYTIKDKKKTLFKFKQKIQEIQCANVVIVQFILNKFKETISLPTYNEDRNVSKIKRIYIGLKRKLAKMLSVLYETKTTAEKWLWVLYFRVCGVVEDEFEEFALPNSSYLVDDEKLNSDISKSIDMCSKGMLQVMVIDLLDPIDIILETVFEPLYGSYKMDCWLGYQFSLKNLYLLELHDKHDTLLRGVKVIKLDRIKMKENLDNERTLMNNFVASRMWVRQPFPDNKYLKHVLRILKIKLYLHSWLHLKAFLSIRCKYGVNKEIERSNNNFIYELESSAKKVFFKENIGIEELITFLINELLRASETDIENMADRIMEKVKFILIPVNITVSNPPVQDFDIKFMNTNTSDLREYFYKLKTKKGQFDFSFTSFLLKTVYDDKYTIRAIFR